MSLYHTLKFIATHPLNKKNPLGGLYRFVSWQLRTRLSNKLVICDFATKSKLLVARGMTGATQNIYCGLQEFNDMAFVLHFLRASDQFIDIGANIGSYTVLASSEVGAATYAVEPLPATFENLQKNIKLNDLQESVTSYNVGVGDCQGMLSFTKGLDTMNHVALAGEQHTIEVPVHTFDHLFKLSKPTLIKIDTEGFEAAVLAGMNQALKNTHIEAIIIELNGLSKRYGYDDEQVHQSLIESGFSPYDYHPFKRKLDRKSSYGPHNTLYLRNLDFCERRVKSAPLWSILSSEF